MIAVAEIGLSAIGAVVQGLVRDGWAAVPCFLDEPATASLRTHACELENHGQLSAAGIGRGVARRERADIRGDRIAWIDSGSTNPGESRLRARLEFLRLAINRETSLGLFEFEGHYALYSPGASYARHRDRFVDDDARLVSCVLYLNDAWKAAHGGALRIYLADDRTIDVLPQAGTLVAFLSERFDHEVLRATRPRRSIAGWFRRRTADFL